MACFVFAFAFFIGNLPGKITVSNFLPIKPSVTAKANPTELIERNNNFCSSMFFMKKRAMETNMMSIPKMILFLNKGGFTLLKRVAPSIIPVMNANIRLNGSRAIQNLITTADSS